MKLACHGPDGLFPDTASGNHMFLVDQAAETPERSSSAWDSDVRRHRQLRRHEQRCSSIIFYRVMEARRPAEPVLRPKAAAREEHREARSPFLCTHLTHPLFNSRPQLRRTSSSSGTRRANAELKKRIPLACCNFVSLRNTCSQ